MATDTPRIPEQGVATLPDEAWERARRRAEIISPLAQSETVGHEAADMAAQALGLSRRQVYVLIRRARQGSGLVTDLVPGQSRRASRWLSPQSCSLWLNILAVKRCRNDRVALWIERDGGDGRPVAGSTWTPATTVIPVTR